MKFLGVDPGVHGGLAIVRIENGAAPQLIDAIHVPLVGTGARERVDVIGLQKWLLGHAPSHAFIERAQAWPEQGRSGIFRYARATGSIEATIITCAIPVEFVEPTMWKRALRLHGRDKEGSRQYALQIFPRAHHLLQRKMDHQRAEAALIALHGARQHATVWKRCQTDVESTHGDTRKGVA